MPPAPRVPDLNAQRLAMKQLEFLVGTWEGSSRVLRGPGTSLDMDQTERAEYRLDGLVLLIEGIGRDRKNGAPMLQALGIVSYDDEHESYCMRAFNDGRFLETQVRLLETDRTLTWGFTVGEFRTTSVLRVSEDGDWTERTELTVGTQTPKVLMELAVRRSASRR